MPEVVLPIERRYWIMQTVFAACTALLGVFLIGAGTSTFSIAVGALCVVMFGSLFAGNMRRLSSPGMVLRSDDFSYAGHTFTRAQVAGFKPVGLLAKTHIRILLRQDDDLPSGLKFANSASKVGFNFPSIHIPMRGFVTDGRTIGVVLDDWLQNSAN